MGSPPNCLRNRLDQVPCNIVNTDLTDVPQDKYVPYTCAPLRSCNISLVPDLLIYTLAVSMWCTVQGLKIIIAMV